MREITGHKVNPANDKLNVYAIDEPGSGGANHVYEITGLPAHSMTIEFQNGPINEAGVNGITHEVLLAILIDRMQAFQSGKFANDFNGHALACMLQAQAHLLDRTRERMSRSVEGTHAV